MIEEINLRSDTQTLPTEEMLEKMHKASLGDDTFNEDPTVNKLEKIAAEMMGVEDALFVISGTMGNLLALMVHAKPGDEVLLDRHSHIFAYEGGGMANIAGLMPRPLNSHAGVIDREELELEIRKENIHFPNPRLLCLENSHNLSGGCYIPVETHRALCDTARSRGLSIHLDGARIFNACIASGASPSDYTESVDSVMFCLSKGLSAPLGSLLAGKKDFVEKARKIRKTIGGGMRQAGVIAAAGIVALETMVDRLEEDHALARKLGKELNTFPGIRVDMESVQTNMVVMDHEETGISTEEMVGLLKKAGVLVSPRPPYRIRLVLHRHHNMQSIEEALRRIQEVVLDNSGNGA